MPCEDHTSSDTLAFPVGNYVNAALGNYVNENLLKLGNYLTADRPPTLTDDEESPGDAKPNRFDLAEAFRAAAA